MKDKKLRRILLEQGVTRRVAEETVFGRRAHELDAGPMLAQLKAGLSRLKTDLVIAKHAIERADERPDEVMKQVDDVRLQLDALFEHLGLEWFCEPQVRCILKKDIEGAG